ncbi:uncharacterized protein LOC125947746 [Dermacentor silvarum]|uniref:uncharacterized protein LOC125947746 n=1 Tax=Dermacentor silvarum TaxID=543639 RepID=UPI002101AA30|nr:uncharacterized protein LOC125947746 [Dermacentor silvarum]
MDASKKRAHLLTLCGEQPYDIVCALVQPKQPNQVSYDDIVEMLKAHLDPQPSAAFCRARFQRRDQRHNEIVLKRLAAECNFGTSADAEANQTILPLEIMLRDRFVCGLRNEQVQQRLFAEKDLTFTKAFDIALRAENAVEDQRNVKAEFKEIHEACTSISKTENQGHSSTSCQKKKERCWRCDTQHSPDTCKFQTASCNYCKKRGHIEKTCLKKTDSPDAALYELNTLIDASNTQKVMTQLRVHGKSLEFEVDSGATCTLIGEATFKYTWIDEPPRLETDILLRIWYKALTLPLVAIKGAGCNLLGRNWFPHLGIQITRINDVSDDELVSKLLDKYQFVFDENISGHVGPENSPPKAPIATWDRPHTPWHTVYVDFAGPLLGRTYMVVVDAHTKWVEVRHVTQATSAVVIDVL